MVIIFMTLRQLVTLNSCLSDSYKEAPTFLDLHFISK